MESLLEFQENILPLIRVITEGKGVSTLQKLTIFILTGLYHAYSRCNMN